MTTTTLLESTGVVAPPLTWAEMCVIKPRLSRLLREIQRVRDDGQSEYFCRNKRWYGWPPRDDDGYKSEMHALVGFYAARPELATSQAYDVAYRTLYRALPPCRGPCGCGWH